jgi:hypothetical protein
MEFLWAGLSFVVGVTMTLGWLEVLASIRASEPRQREPREPSDAELDVDLERAYIHLDRWA